MKIKVKIICDRCNGTGGPEKESYKTFAFSNLGNRYPMTTNQCKKCKGEKELITWMPIKDVLTYSG